jgi:hypothetical protein
MSYSVLSPYRMPAGAGATKRINYGDGFILEAVIKQLSPHHCDHVFSSRAPLTDDQIARVNSSKALVLAGANQLDDHFSVWPGATLADLEKIHVPIIPFGIGVNGEEGKNDGMSETTRDVLRLIHSRTRYSSWRCPLTMDYLNRNLPELGDHYLLTGCPVMFLGDGREETFQLPVEPRAVAVTITDRDEFWERETATIDFVANEFPGARKWLVLHQPAIEKSLKKRLKAIIRGKPGKWRTTAGLCRYAERSGFEVFEGAQVEDFLNLYRSVDIHIGSRLHAHLFTLSLRKPSFVTYVDERVSGFAKMLGFPVYHPSELHRYRDYDFTICWDNMKATGKVMEQFAGYVKDEILGR